MSCSWYQDFFAYMKSTVMSSQALLHKLKLHFCLFLLNPKSIIKMKFGQILVCCIKNISNMFWLNAGDRKLVSGPFMILLITI